MNKEEVKRIKLERLGDERYWALSSWHEIYKDLKKARKAGKCERVAEMAKMCRELHQEIGEIDKEIRRIRWAD